MNNTLPPYATVLPILFVILLASDLKVYSQCPLPAEIKDPIFEKVYGFDGNDKAFNIIPIDTDEDADMVPDNGYVLVGSSEVSENKDDAYVALLNSAFVVLDDEAFEGGEPNENDVTYSVIQTSTGAVVVCGYVTSDKFGTEVNKNVWLHKFDVNDGILDGIDGWPKEYGSTGKDIGYDIAEDLNGNYVIVGTTDASGNDLGSQAVDGAGDIWVFKISPSGALNITDNSRVYDGSVIGSSLDGPDVGRNITIDCSTGHYIVSAFCHSCDDGTHSDALLIKIPPNFSANPAAYYGNTGKDHGSYHLIQPWAIYGVCNSGGDYLSLGISHQGSGGCYGTGHKDWAFRANNNLSVDSDFDDWCTDDANAGVSYGGARSEDGYSIVQTCDGGYLFAGATNSSSESGDVTCNNDDDGVIPHTTDVWLAKVGSNGAFEWDASFGDVGPDGAYSIIRIPDGSYVMAGFITDVSNLDFEFYIVKFELTATCTVPSDLAVSTTTYCATVTWTTDPCVGHYSLEYKKNTASTWVVEDYVTSPFVITSPYEAGGINFKCRLRAFCSPGNPSSYTNEVGLHLGYCGGTLEDCVCSARLVGKESTHENGLLTVYPNPSNGSFEISLQLSPSINQLATVRILDQAGRIVLTAQVPIENGLLWHHAEKYGLPSGFYSVRVITDSREYWNKVAVQKE